MRRVEDDLALVGRRRAEHAKERQLCALVRERGVVAAIDHEDGFGQPRREVDLIESCESRRLLEHATVKKDDRPESIFECRDHHSISTSLAHAQVGNPSLVDVVPGIYGVIAYVVSQKTREIGIRIALGAQRAVLSQVFVRQGLLLAGAGVALGLAAAAALTHLMSSLLFGVTALDPLTYAVVSVLLLVVSVLASYLPARRAMVIDPLHALRGE